MADYGTATLMDPPAALLAANLATYVAGTDQPQPYPVAATLMPLPPDITMVATVPSYGVGGTVDNAYHPPVVGQLWPRGDLDAE